MKFVGLIGLTMAIHHHDTSLIQWDNDLPDFYKGYDSVIEKSGSEAVDTLNNNPLIKGQPELMLAYHPQCGHCHKTAPEILDLADELKKEDLGASVVAVNMSKVN